MVALMISYVLGVTTSDFVLYKSNPEAFVNPADAPKLQKALESAYFEGQKDALNGDIRIQFRSDSCWHWTKSPWDGGKPFSFDPTTKPGRK